MEHRISQLLAGYEEGAITRRSLIAGLAALMTTSRAAQGSTFRGTELNHIALSVTDVARSRDFYQKHFGLALLRESSSNCFLDLGDDFLALFQGSRPGMHHYCIGID